MTSAQFGLHDVLKDASLETACDLASRLERVCYDLDPAARDMAEDLSLMLEYLRLHFNLVRAKD